MESVYKKQCSKCKEYKPYTEFHKDGFKKDELRSHCIRCRCRGNKNKSFPIIDGFKQCTKCEKIKHVSEFHIRKTDPKVCYRSECKKCRFEYTKNYRKVYNQKYKEYRNKYNLVNIDKIRSQKRSRSRFYIDNLNDWYVKEILKDRGIPAEISNQYPELIELQREIIKTYRLWKSKTSQS